MMLIQGVLPMLIDDGARAAMFRRDAMLAEKDGELGATARGRADDLRAYRSRTHAERVADRKREQKSAEQALIVARARSAKRFLVDPQRLEAAGCPKLAGSYRRWYRILANGMNGETGSQNIARLLELSR